MAAIFVGGRVRGPGDVFMKLWVLVVVVLSLNPAHQLVRVEGARNLSEEEEDLELEMQLQTLNKPPVKTIHTEWGDILDCINIHQQPAFDHPLLKNHKIQMKPSGRVRDVTSSFTGKHKKSIFMTPVEKCPKGTVPIRRTQKQDLIKAKSLSPSSLSSINSGGSTENNDPTQSHAGLVYQVIGETFYGATADINIHNPIVAKGQFSAAEIALEAGPVDQYNGIHFGWMVNPDLFPDNLPRTHTYWTGDGGHKTGCFNTLCSGFVQVHQQVTIGSPLQSSTFGGIQNVHKPRVFQDNETKNWWLQYQENINVGYWPTSLFPLFAAGAQYIFWGGSVKAGGDGMSPQMGNGHYPDGKYKEACFFANMEYVNGSNVQQNPKEDKMINRLQCQKLYGLKYYGFQKTMGHTFLFGGPGGKCD